MSKETTEEIDGELTEDQNPTDTAATQPRTKSERELDTETCARNGCEREVFKEVTVDVVAGEVVEKGNYPDPYVKVQGVEQGPPEVDQYCPQCADDEHDITKPAGARSIEHTNRILTPSNIISAMVAGTLVFVLMSVLIWMV